MNLIVEDKYISEMGEFLLNEYTELQDAIERYQDILLGLLDQGFMEGRTHDAIQEFVDQVSAFGKMNNTSATSTGKKYKMYCDQYISKLDDADRNL